MRFNISDIYFFQLGTKFPTAAHQLPSNVSFVQFSLNFLRCLNCIAEAVSTPISPVMLCPALLCATLLLLTPLETTEARALQPSPNAVQVRMQGEGGRVRARKGKAQR